MNHSGNLTAFNLRLRSRLALPTTQSDKEYLEQASEHFRLASEQNMNYAKQRAYLLTAQSYLTFVEKGDAIVSEMVAEAVTALRYS